MKATSTIVTIHQPEHLPWLGFFDKMDQADIFVFLDNVQFKKNNFQNRNKIMCNKGSMWLTVPVHTKGHMLSQLKDIRIANTCNWEKKYRKSIKYCYQKHPYFDEYFRFFDIACNQTWEYLADLNLSIIKYLAEKIGISTRFVMASELDVLGAKSELLLNICKEMGATIYLAGMGAKDYLDEKLFSQSGIRVSYQRFCHPTYPQYGARDFVSHLSVLDLLFNHGSGSLGIIRKGRQNQ